MEPLLDMKPQRWIRVLASVAITLSVTAQANYGQDLLSTQSVFIFKRPSVKGVKPKRQAYRKKGIHHPRTSSTVLNTTVAVGINDKDQRLQPPKPEEQVGITLWKLRPEISGETGARLLTMGKQSADNSKLIAQRVELDTVFTKGDKVRISIESPRTGYLYVVDREIKKDKSLGEPYLIFPTLRTRGGDNSVGTGKVIEIPAQTDDPFFFEITPTESNYAGEMLTILVSPTKIEGLSLSDAPIKLQSSLVAEWERKWEKPATAFELEGGTGQKYTEDEKVAGAGARQLTHKSPSPQSVLIVEAPKSSAFMVSFPMRVSQ